YARSLREIAAAASAPVVGVISRRHARFDMRDHPGIPDTFDGICGRTQITDPAGYRPRIMTVVSTGTETAPAAIVWQLACIASKSGLRTEVATGDKSMHEYLLAEQNTMSCRAPAPVVLPAHT